MPGRLLGWLVGVAVTVALYPAAAGAAVEQRRVSFLDEPLQAPIAFFTGGGLELRGSCTGPASDAEVNLYVRSQVENADVQLNVQRADQELAGGDSDFDPGDAFEPLSGLVSHGSAAGQIVFRAPGGTIVTVDYASFQGQLPFGAPNDEACAIVGSAQVAGPGAGSKSRRPIRYGGARPKTFFKARGLRLRGRCSPSGRLTVAARSRVRRATLHANTEGTPSGERYYQRNRLGPRKKLRLFNDSTGGRSGQLIFVTPRGLVVTIDLMILESAECGLVGTARSLGRGSGDRLLYRGREDSDFRTLLGFGEIDLRAACGAGSELGFRYDHEGPASGHVTASQMFPDSIDWSTGASGVGSGFSSLLPFDATDASASHSVIALETGRIVTLDWLAEEENGFGRRADCLVAGSLERLPPLGP